MNMEEKKELNEEELEKEAGGKSNLQTCWENKNYIF